MDVVMTEHATRGPDTGDVPGQRPVVARRVIPVTLTSPIAITLETEKLEFAHEALLKEMHKADDLAETHSTLVVTISGAAFAFAVTQLENTTVVISVAVFGILVALEWLLKIIRHNQIFVAARNKLVAVEGQLRITTARPPATYISGFNILRLLASLFLAGWVLVIIAVSFDLLNLKQPAADQVFNRVTKEVSAVAHVEPGKWTLLSMIWNNEDHTYKLILSPIERASEKWEVVYDVNKGRLMSCQKE
jgi:hypothetical protein